MQNVVPQEAAFGHPRPFRIRFSLRALLIAVTIIAVLLGAWGDRARKQREGVAWVLEQGGHIIYDYERPEADGSYRRNAKPPGPKWLHELLGIDYFAAVRAVVLDRDEIDDLAPLANFPRLESLALMNYVDPQTDFSPLRSLKRLEQLHLSYTGLDASQLEPIRVALPGCRIESFTDPELNHRPSVLGRNNQRTR